jgi:Kef-type K+ transport system membrane component KefB
VDLAFLPDWPPALPAALAVAALALLAAAAGQGAALLRLPRLFGYVAAGALFGAGSYLLRLLQLEALPTATLQFALEFSAAVIVFDVGQRVSFGWIRRNPALAATSVVESTLTFGVVFATMHWFGVMPWAAAMIAAISIATSPAVLLSVTRELRTQGQVTERVLLLAALNSIYAGLLSTLLLAISRDEASYSLADLLLQPAYLIVGSVAVAALGARLFLLALSFVGRDRAAQVLVMLAVVWIVFAAAAALQLSQLLALLACGAFVRVFDRARLLTATEFGLASGIALVLFFALSAATIDFDALTVAWLPAVALAAVRVLAKCAALTAFGPLTGITYRKGLMTGVGLLPMSALALMLIQQVSTWNPALAQQTSAVLLPAIVMMQLVGALAVVLALRWSGEARTER